MKQYLLLLVAVAMVCCTITSCSQTQQGGTANVSQSTTVPDQSNAVSQSVVQPDSITSSPNGDNHILIAYFSLWDNAPWEGVVDTNTSASVVADEGETVGTNGYMARMIQNAVGGDIHMIVSEEPYPADFDEVVDQNHQETSRSISSKIENIEQYDVIFIGYPVWASDLPYAVRTFLSEYDFSGKTVIPFCTHNGYGAGSSFSTVTELAAGAETLEGLAIRASETTDSADVVAEWLQQLNLSSDSNEDSKESETAVRITIGELEAEGVLYNSSMAQQFIDQLPQTITMSNYGGREVYGGIEQALAVEGEGQLYFDDGDITYCPSNNTAAIFYSQSSHPNLTMRVYPIGKVTSDLSIFPNLPSQVEITFEVTR